MAVDSALTREEVSALFDRRQEAFRSRRSKAPPAVFLYQFRNRKIARESRIYDFSGVLVQIGLLKTKPG